VKMVMKIQMYMNQKKNTNIDHITSHTVQSISVSLSLYEK